MRRSLLSPSRLLRSPDLPFLVLWLASLLAGILVFRDFGLAWDEPLFYQYSDAVGSAYSIPDWLNGSIDLERAYGPSAEDHKIYGAAYLLIGRNVTRALQALTGAEGMDRLAPDQLPGIRDRGALPLPSLQAVDAAAGGDDRRRAVPQPARGLGSRVHQSERHAVRHALHPGDLLRPAHGGSHRGAGIVVRAPGAGAEAHRTARLADGDRPSAARRAALAGLVCALVALALAGFGETWRGALGDVVRQAYYAAPDSSLGRAFAWLASSRQVPLRRLLSRPGVPGLPMGERAGRSGGADPRRSLPGASFPGAG